MELSCLAGILGWFAGLGAVLSVLCTFVFKHLPQRELPFRDGIGNGLVWDCLRLKAGGVGVLGALWFRVVTLRGEESQLLS